MGVALSTYTENDELQIPSFPTCKDQRCHSTPMLWTVKNENPVNIHGTSTPLPVKKIKCEVKTKQILTAFEIDDGFAFHEYDNAPDTPLDLHVVFDDIEYNE